jgi:hypothetical protein
MNLTSKFNDKLYCINMLNFYVVISLVEYIKLFTFEYYLESI